MAKPITRQDVEQFAAEHRPDLAIDEINGHKGIYKPEFGQAQTFETKGDTWKQVLEWLRWTVSPDARV